MACGAPAELSWDCPQKTPFGDTPTEFVLDLPGAVPIPIVFGLISCQAVLALPSCVNSRLRQYDILRDIFHDM